MNHFTPYHHRDRREETAVMLAVFAVAAIVVVCGVICFAIAIGGR